MWFWAPSAVPRAPRVPRPRSRKSTASRSTRYLRAPQSFIECLELVALLSEAGHAFNSVVGHVLQSAPQVRQPWYDLSLALFTELWLRDPLIHSRLRFGSAGAGWHARGAGHQAGDSAGHRGPAAAAANHRQCVSRLSRSRRCPLELNLGVRVVVVCAAGVCQPQTALGAFGVSSVLVTFGQVCVQFSGSLGSADRLRSRDAHWSG